MRVVRTLVALLIATLWLTIPANAQTNPSTEKILEAGRSALRQKHYAEAIRLLEDGLKQFPNDRRLMVELGKAYLYNRQDKQAMQLFRQVLREDPSNPTAKLELARALGYHRDFQASNKLYRELIAANPNDEAASIGLVRNLMHQEQLAQARRELDQALARHPDSKRLLEYSERLDKEAEKEGDRRRGGREPAPAGTKKESLVQGSGAYFSDSAGNRSWRSTQRADFGITHALAGRFLAEERTLWDSGVAGPKANVFWGTGELRLRLTPSLLFGGGGGAVRFADGTHRALYRAELELHPAKRLWLRGEFSNRPIAPTIQAAQLDLRAEGWRTGLEWYPGPWRMSATASSEHYSDGNRGTRASAGLLRWLGSPRLGLAAGYRFDYLTFEQSFLNGYFNPSSYYSHLGLTGVRFRLGKAFRGEYLAGAGAESISSLPYRLAWELSLRNRVRLANWELGGDYFYFHLAESTGPSKSQAGRFVVTYSF